MKMINNGLAIFAKVPIPGQVKTRLLPEVSREAAADLYRAFVLDTLNRCKPDMRIRRYLACHPCAADPYFQSLRDDHRVELLDQHGRDLGERMAGVVLELFSRGLQRIVLVGTDSPTLPPRYLKQAFEALRGRPVVLGPSRDGGYYLIGFSQWVPDVFNGIGWGTSGVLGETLEVLNRLNRRVEILPEWFDVDDFQGLSMLRSQLAETPSLAPETWAWIMKYRAFFRPRS